VAIYEKDAAEADRRLKGKVVYMNRGLDDPWPCKTDESGDKYVPWPPQHFEGAGIGRELVRFYGFLPKAPVIKRHGEFYTVMGVCLGKRDGRIILRDCSFSGEGGTDW
jgi:hypothetical protein